LEIVSFGDLKTIYFFIEDGEKVPRKEILGDEILSLFQ
jgi:hypothetical protein